MPPSTLSDPSTCPLSELTQHIRESHHAYLRTELPIIWDLLREAAASRSSGADDIKRFAILFGRFRAELDNHLRKEDEVLFPFIECLDHAVRDGVLPPRHRFGPLARPIEVLEAEHALGDRLLERMRPMWLRWASGDDAVRRDDALIARLEGLDADMQRHVHMEDHILFPRTIALEGRQ